MCNVAQGEYNKLHSSLLSQPKKRLDEPVDEPDSLLPCCNVRSHIILRLFTRGLMLADKGRVVGICFLRLHALPWPLKNIIN